MNGFSTVVPILRMRADRAERFQPHKAATPAASSEEGEIHVRLMTIFQLAALSERELAALARRATEEATNANLAPAEREAASRTLETIRRLGFKPSRG